VDPESTCARHVRPPLAMSWLLRPQGAGRNRFSRNVFPSGQGLTGTTRPPRIVHMFESGWSGATSVVDDEARARLLAHPETAWLPGELDPVLYPYDYPYVPVPAHLAHAHTDTHSNAIPIMHPLKERL